MTEAYGIKKNTLTIYIDVSVIDRTIYFRVAINDVIIS